MNKTKLHQGSYFTIGAGCYYIKGIKQTKNTLIFFMPYPLPTLYVLFNQLLNNHSKAYVMILELKIAL